MKPISTKSQRVTRPSPLEQRQVVSTQCREAITKYLESEDLEHTHCEVMLQLVDLYGLVHPVQPSVGMTARAIRQHAKAAGLTAQKKTWRLLKRCSPLERKHSQRDRTRTSTDRGAGAIVSTRQRRRGHFVLVHTRGPCKTSGWETTGTRGDAVSSSRRAIFTRRGRPHSGSCGRMSGRDTGTV